jgi:hypothetical protein
MGYYISYRLRATGQGQHLRFRSELSRRVWLIGMEPYVDVIRQWEG